MASRRFLWRFRIYGFEKVYQVRTGLLVLVGQGSRKDDL